ncbi:MAG: acyl-CoA dehydrogenase family protein [Bacteroidota bacterium]
MLSEVKVFLDGTVRPLEPLLLSGRYGELMPALDALRGEVKRRGWWNPHLPVEAGGLGMSLVEFGRLSEVLGTTPLGHYLFNCQAPDAGNQEILLHHATPAQRDRFLDPLLRGDVRSCFAMTEPEHAGSNPVWMSTTAVREGDDYVLNGHKWFTTAADGAAFTIVMAVTNPEAERAHERASQLIVPMDTLGLVHVRRLPVMGDEGAGYFSHSELRFEACRVPVANRLGGEGAGFRIAQERLGPGRIHHCMRWVGVCERAFELMVHRAATRELNPGEPLAKRQTVQNWIAESRAEIHAARLMVLDAAEAITRDGARAARMQISMIKFFVAGVLQRVLDRAVQTHGALGLTDDLVLAHWYRHERAARVYDGPDEVHKSVVAREVLRRL